MSAVSSVSSSADSYPAQLTQAAALRQSLINIGNAVQSGNMTTAGTLLTAFMNDNPQYASSSGSGDSQDPINQDFQNLATAIGNNQAGAAQSAWSQVTSALAQDGVNLSSGSASTAQIVAQSKATVDQEILTDMFGSSSSSGGTPSLASFVAGTSDSSGGTGLPSSVLSNWLTYKENGNTTPSASSAPSGSILDTTG